MSSGRQSSTPSVIESGKSAKKTISRCKETFFAKKITEFFSEDNFQLIEIQNYSQAARDVLVPFFIEALIGYGYCGAVTPFLDNNEQINNPFVSTSLLLLANLLIRTGNLKITGNSANLLLRIVRSGCFATIDNKTRDILLHEGAHLVGMLAVVKGTPHITLQPNFFSMRGETSYPNPLMLSPFGQQLGLDPSEKLVSAAGTIGTTLWSQVSLLIAQMIPDQYPEVKLHIRLAAWMSIISSVSYALSAYSDECKNPNDFCKIRDSLSPGAAIAAIVGSMVLVQAMLSGITACRKSKRRRLDIQDETPKVEEVTDGSITSDANETLTSGPDESTPLFKPRA